MRFDWRQEGCGEGRPDGFGRNLLNRVLPRHIDGQARLTYTQNVCDYSLEGRSALLAPIDHDAVEPMETGGRQDWRPRQDSNL